MQTVTRRSRRSIGSVRESRIPTLYEIDTLAPLIENNNKIFGLLARGIPGSLDTAEHDQGNLKGKYGEAVIGSLLNILALDNPAMYVFHSVANPAYAPIGETDHILLYRDRLILVETKTYNNFSELKISKEGDLRGVPLDNPRGLKRLDNNNLISKVRLYEKAYPGLQVQAITAVTCAGISTRSENGKYKVASLTNLSESLNYHIQNSGEVSREMTGGWIRQLASRCLGASRNG